MIPEDLMPSSLSAESGLPDDKSLRWARSHRHTHTSTHSKPTNKLEGRVHVKWCLWMACDVHCRLFATRYFSILGKKRKGGKSGKCDGWMSVIPRQLFSTMSDEAKSASSQPHPWVNAAKCEVATHTRTHTQKLLQPPQVGR